MHFSITTALFLAASAVAVPAPVNVNMNMVRLKEAIATNYTWTVSSWKTAGCAGASTSGCTYSFQVSAPASGDSVPAFNASCAGTLGAPYETCAGPAAGQAVKARLDVANTTDSAGVAVSYEFSDPSDESIYWNYTAHATRPFAQSGVFAIQPSEVWGVA